MRDTFLGLNQRRVLELKQRYLDGKGESFIKTEDLILIRRIQDFMNSSKSIQVVFENDIYSWVHYETVQEDLPMIFPSVVSLKKRVEKLKKLGLLINKDYTVTKSNALIGNGFKNPGKYSVIRLSKDCKMIFDFSDCKEGFYHEGVKGQHHEGVKGQHHEGVNKEYLDLNTVKKTPNVVISSEQSEYAKKISVHKEKMSLKIREKNFKLTPEDMLKWAGGDYELVERQFEHFSDKGVAYLRKSIQDKYEIPKNTAKEKNLDGMLKGIV